MKANKVTVTIVIEGLSVDVIAGLAAKAADQIEREFTNGELVAEDGDTVRWSTEIKPVSF